MPITFKDIKHRARPPVDFNKIEDFIIWLKNNGFWIRRVTFDGWQSAGSIQAMKTFGISAGVRSVEKSIIPYRILSSVMGGRKMSIPPHNYLQLELGELVYKTGEDKVDHPAAFADGRRGTNDIADALAGATYECIIDRLTPSDLPADSAADHSTRYDQYLEDAKNAARNLK